MKILIAYYSRTGYTKELALILAEKLKEKGHELFFEEITPTKYENKWPFIWREIWFYPALGINIFSYAHANYFFNNYRNPEVDISPLTYPDISEFDRVCIGSPKHAVLSYPITRYLKTINGMKDSKIGFFATFGGPPFKRFEIESIFRPAGNIITRRGGKLVSILGLSTGFHEYYIMSLFNLLSKIRFGKTTKDFTIYTEYGKKAAEQFIERLIDGTGNIVTENGWNGYTGKGLPLAANDNEGKVAESIGKLFK